MRTLIYTVYTRVRRCEEGEGGGADLRDAVVHAWVLSLMRRRCRLAYGGRGWLSNGGGVFEHGWGLRTAALCAFERAGGWLTRCLRH
jgi:hypothetical protein